jgi:hypothetical protein
MGAPSLGALVRAETLESQCRRRRWCCGTGCRTTDAASDSVASTFSLVFDALYHCFAIRPWGKIARAIKAAPKLYLFDILQLPAANAAARLEKPDRAPSAQGVSFLDRSRPRRARAPFRARQRRREVDFLILRDRKPWMLVECTSDDVEPSSCSGSSSSSQSAEHSSL